MSTDMLYNFVCINVIHVNRDNDINSIFVTHPLHGRILPLKELDFSIIKTVLYFEI